MQKQNEPIAKIPTLSRARNIMARSGLRRSSHCFRDNQGSNESSQILVAPVKYTVR